MSFFFLRITPSLIFYLLKNGAPHLEHCKSEEDQTLMLPIFKKNSVLQHRQCQKLLLPIKVVQIPERNSLGVAKSRVVNVCSPNIAIFSIPWRSCRSPVLSIAPNIHCILQSIIHAITHTFISRKYSLRPKLAEIYWRHSPFITILQAWHHVGAICIIFWTKMGLLLPWGEGGTCRSWTGRRSRRRCPGVAARGGAAEGG